MRILALALPVWVLLMGLVQAFDIKFANREKIMGWLAIVGGALGIIAILGTL